MPFRLDHPEYLSLLLLALPIVWLGRRSLASLERGRQWTAIGLRLAVLLVIVLMLAGLEAVRWHHDLTVMVVMDRSESVRRFVEPPPQGDEPSEGVLDWVHGWILGAADDRRADDRMGLVAFDGRATVRSMPDPVIDLEGAIVEVLRPGTDIASAIRLAMAVFPSDTARRMVLVSDGNDTVAVGGAHDEVMLAAREAAAAGIPIDVLPLEYNVEREVIVDGVYAPVDVREGQPVPVRVALRATQPAAGTLFLLHDGKPIDAAGVRVEVDQWGDDGLLVVEFGVAAPPTGVNRFEAVFELDEGFDELSANNRAQGFTFVQGKGKLLIVDGVGGESGAILPDALRARGMDLQVIGPEQLPATLAQMQRYDAVVLQNVPAELVPPSQQKMIAQYVTELGGGLVMIGGPDSFGAGGWANTAIDDVLPVMCELPKQTVLPSGALVMVIDRSGSMQEPVGGTTVTKQQVANEAAALAALTLFEQDMVGVLAFNNSGEWIVPLAPYTEPHVVDELIHSIQPDGGTNIYGPLRQAYEALAAIDNQAIMIKHIILLTDGRGAGGDYDTLLEHMHDDGVTLSTVGAGDDIDAELLNRLAVQGRGVFHAVTDPNDLPRIFIKEARQVRKALIREVPFDPIVFGRQSPITAGINAAPRLRGMILTGSRADPRVFMPMTGPQGEPLFAHWQIGLGRSAAFTSDANNRWAVDWLSWSGYPDFWARTMRAIARPNASRELDMVADIERDTLRVRLDTGPASGVEKVTGSLINPDGQSVPITLDAVGPGAFAADLPASEQGNYIVSLFTESQGGSQQYVYGGATREPGNELRAFASDRALLVQVAELTGGRVLDPRQHEADLLFRRDGTLSPSRSLKPLWRPLLVVLIVLFLLDVASRRVAWDFAAIISRLRHAPVARDTDSQGTLDALKRRAKRVDKELDEKSADPGRKFVAPAKARPSKDFARAVGGAKQQSSTDPPPEKPTSSAGSTSRLLDAKRRAQQRMNDQEDDQ
jgi:uncharacterized membrane protein